MNSSVIIPGPEVVLWWGVHIPVLSAAFGIAGILLGHLMAPAAAVPLPPRRQAAVVIAGVLVSLGISISTGQRPLVVLAWSIGIGFAGITIFQTLGGQATRASRDLTDMVIDRITGRASGAGGKDSAP
ncbi:hypothetical protein [Sphingomonas sp. CROZ-RG-20F-R02-07]|uniref:hypothetical protein n=1 Tax=Sphingomonas sp. CROZ-RG-20F-R02-07 TaxID=2914832 RepID=UPI001F55EDF6|nr:hypothetical protein [Sphingomonas sp. CROZ-RG-20F-R02-07]